MTKEEVIELYNHLYKKENKEEMFAIDNFPNMTEKKCDAVKQIGIDDVKKLCAYHHKKGFLLGCLLVDKFLHLKRQELKEIEEALMNYPDSEIELPFLKEILDIEEKDLEDCCEKFEELLNESAYVENPELYNILENTFSEYRLSGFTSGYNYMVKMK